MASTETRNGDEEQIEQGERPPHAATPVRRHPASERIEFVAPGPAVWETWQQLERALPTVSVFQSALWTRTWVEHYGDAVSTRASLFHAGGAVRGVALVTESQQQREGPFSIRTLHLGTAGESPADSVCVEFNGPLAAPEHRAAFSARLRERIDAIPGWDRLNLDGVPADDFELLRGADAGWESRLVPSRYFDLAQCRASGKLVLEELPRNRRGDIRRKLKQLSDVQLDWLEGAEASVEAFDELVALHQGRWESVGKPGVFSQRRFCAFHRTFLTRAAGRQSAALVRVRDGKTTLGVIYGLLEPRRFLVYQCGFNRELWSLGPGMISHALAMQAALERGYDEYDFLAGEQNYKRHLSNAARELVWAALPRDRYVFHLMKYVRQIKRSVAAFLRKPARSMAETLANEDSGVFSRSAGERTSQKG